MTPTGTLPDSPRIQRLRRRLARWRQTRRHARAPIPAAVWTAAVALARQHGLYQTARALPISYGALKAHVERATRVDQETQPPRFVELLPASARHVSECVIELDAPHGTTRLRVSGLALSDLVALTRALGGRDMIQITPQMRILVAVEAERNDDGHAIPRSGLFRQIDRSRTRGVPHDPPGR